MKKLISLILAVMLVMALAVPAMAAEETPVTASITLPDDGHSYKIYQIFTGDVDNGELSGIKWGTDGSGETGKGVDATTLAAIVAISGTNATKGDAIKTYVTGNGTSYFGEGQIIPVAPGYYMIEDTAIDPENPDDFISLYVVEVCDFISITRKGDKPEVEKKVKDINDSEYADISDNAWQDSADFDFGDDVPFKLTATMPDSFDGYDTYKVIFHDTLSAGLDYNNDAVVKLNDTPLTAGYVVEEKNGELLITLANVLGADVGAKAGDTITVEYTAKLLTTAQIGSAGNPNKVYLEYSNNPNATGEGTTGKTPEDKVIVFTYKVVVDKQDESGAALAGAGFTLYKQTGTKTTGEGDNAKTEPVWTAVGAEVKGTVDEPMTTFIWEGLDDGVYKLEETTVPKNYNKMEDQIFIVTATHTDGEEPELTDLTGEVTTGTITFTPSVPDGSLTTTVVNQSGAVLPETGGIGTTIFYVLGGVLLIGAAVLLITKKRMGSND